MKSSFFSFLLRGNIGRAALVGIFAGSMVASAQGYRPYRSSDSPVARTEQDLEAFARHSASFDSGHERSRYDNALRHLSEFQNDLYRGHLYDHKLGHAIDDVESLIRHNPLDERARGILFDDVNRLRAFRATRGYMPR